MATDQRPLGGERVNGDSVVIRCWSPDCQHPEVKRFPADAYNPDLGLRTLDEHWRSVHKKLPPEPEGRGARREWTWRSTPTAANPNGVVTQGFLRTEAEARQWVADRYAEGRGADFTYSVVYRDIGPWTEA